MSVLNYPAFTEYYLPRKNVLVLSCMDLRLTDNLVHFLQFDNLTNRYDHFILAGAALCTCPEHKDLFDPLQLAKYDGFAHWQRALDDHLGLAIALHQIRDVYIIEHEDCGAYANFLKNGIFEDREEEKETHAFFARELAKKINKVTYTETRNGVVYEYRLHVHCFFINLRGEVELQFTTNP